MCKDSEKTDEEIENEKLEKVGAEKREVIKLIRDIIKQELTDVKDYTLDTRGCIHAVSRDIIRLRRMPYGVKTALEELGLDLRLVLQAIHNRFPSFDIESILAEADSKRIGHATHTAEEGKETEEG